MTKQQILDWIEANREEIEGELFFEYDFDSFFDEIEELNLEDNKENLAKKIAKLLSIYQRVKELREEEDDEEGLFSSFLDQIGDKVVNVYDFSEETVKFEDIKKILQQKYNLDIPLYEMFDDFQSNFWKIYGTLLNEKEKVQIVYELIKNNKKEFLTQLDLETIPVEELENNKVFQKTFIEVFYKLKGEELLKILEKINKSKLSRDVVYFLVQTDKRFARFIPQKYLKEDKRLRKLYWELQGIEDPLILAKKVKEKLKNKIYGQEHVIEKITDAIKNKLVFDENSPRYVFSFFGPPATGKTYTAKLLQEVFEDYTFKQFDMSLYEREDSGLGLFGSDFKFKDSEPGELTEFVLNNPKSIIVFDEIEKCHPQVQKQLLTIFSEGYLEDKHGWCKEVDEEGNVIYKAYKSFKDDEYKCEKNERITKVSFKDTIIVFTSNAGENLYSDNKFWKIVEDDLILAENMIIEELKKEKKFINGHEFPAINPALLSRISSGDILLFKELDFESIYKIAKERLEKYNEELILRVGVQFESKDIETFIKIFLLRYFPILDIRRIKSKLANDIYDYISDEMLKYDYTFDDFEEIELEVLKKTKLKFQELLKETPKIKEYFFRKNLTANLNVEYKFDKENKKIIFSIKDFELKKFKNIRDIKEDLLFDVPEIKFDDIAGHKYIKEKLKKIVSLLKNTKKLKQFNIKMSKGVLLYGPPGTGKTMLAKALAAEADLPFFATTGSDIKSYYKNEKGEQKLMMERIFNKAKKYAPSIVFIDEIDALGNRKQNPYEADVINKFLTLLSGFEDEDNFVFVIAATNYEDRIDPAILRPGRIDTHIKIDILDKEARRFFIKKIIKDLNGNENNFDIDKLTILSFGMSGAAFEKLKTEVGTYLIINNKKLDEKILIDFINEVKYGREVEVNENSLAETAYHEAGHAIAAKLLLPQVSIEQATIVARENTLGLVAYNFEEFRGNNITKEEKYNQILVSLAGRAAQKKKFNKIDTGASSDITNATHFAIQYVGKFGFDEEIGNVDFEMFQPEAKEFKKVDDVVKHRVIELLKKATIDTEKFVEENWNKIEKLANALIEKEIVTNNEIEEIIKL